MTDLPTREEVERSSIFDWVIARAYIIGDLLSREEAANDPEVRSMVHDSIAAKWAWLNETEVTDDMSELPTLYRLDPDVSSLRPPYRIVRQANEIGDPVIGQLVPVTETLYVIDVKAFDPYWNESHHEALGAMIDAGLIRPVKEVTDDE